LFGQSRHGRLPYDSKTTHTTSTQRSVISHSAASDSGPFDRLVEIVPQQIIAARETERSSGVREPQGSRLRQATLGRLVGLRQRN
jgi:hypothetical protein